ncbi:CAP domain-containing protein [Romboutsia ilealis]|uniref:CAP domain-containing protein n=1 Tax=Romboutsia ilealis TaxID=1115758 RepID=UPI0023F267BF|nr:CAP domain-containing protein [Romboutsia ilealis]
MYVNGVKFKLPLTPNCPNLPSKPNNTPSNPSTTPEQKPDSAPSNPSTTPEQKPSTDFSSYQQQVLDLVNAERAKRGISALTLDSSLSSVATKKSQDMVNKNYFDHTSPTYGSPFDMMKQFGISYRSAGENIAKGQKTPQEVVAAWMNSEGHRKNILNPNFTNLGVGIAKDSNKTTYWTQMFIGK